MKRNLKVRQMGVKDCATACLLSIIHYYNSDVSKEELEYLIKTSQTGTTAYNMIEGMKKLGFSGYGIHEKIENVFNNNIVLPAIAHTQIGNNYHFIVIYEINTKRKYLKVMDPTFGVKKMKFDEFKNIYLNTLLIFSQEKLLPKLNKPDSFINYILKNVFIKKKVISLIVFLSLLTIIFTIINNFYFKILIDYTLVNFKIKLLICLISVFSLIIIIKNIFSFIRDKLLISITNFISFNITSKVITHILSLPYHFIKNKPTGEVISRINDLNSLKETLSSLVLSIFVDILLIIISFITLIFINKDLLLLSIILIIIYSIIVLIYSIYYKNKILLIQESESDYNTSLMENLEGYESIRNINIMAGIINKLNVKYKIFLNKSMNFQKTINNHNFIKNLINDIGLLLIIGLGSYFVYQNRMTIGDLVIFDTLILYLFEPIKSLLDLIPNIKYALSSYERINDLILIKKEEISYSEELINGNILVKDLKFTYGNGKYILNNLNFNIDIYDKVFLCGYSGSGKSTFIKVLLKYFNDYDGDILINNINLRDIESSIINASFTYVSQNEKLFSMSIKENIYMDRNIDIDKYYKICKICKVDEIINKTKLRDNYLIEENGFNLSGGQRQKIILARGLINASNYIILDEALSEISIYEELEIVENIIKYYKNKTIIYISHKEEISRIFKKKINILGKEKK